MQTHNRILSTGTRGHDPTGARDAGYRAALICLLLPALIALTLTVAASPAQARQDMAPENEPQKDGSQQPTEIEYHAAEIEMARLINDYREEEGLKPLLVSNAASLAAKRHSEDMARYGFIDHESQQSAYFEPGASFDERLAESGYDHDVARSENIAAGADAEQTFEGWKESPEHEENMLDPDMAVVGIGLTRTGDPHDTPGSGTGGNGPALDEGGHGYYWTTDFGGHVDRTATDPSRIESTPAGDAPGEADPIQDTQFHPVSNELPDTRTADDASKNDASNSEPEAGETEVSREQYSTGDDTSNDASKGISDQDSNENPSSAGEHSGEPSTDGEITNPETTEQTTDGTAPDIGGRQTPTGSGDSGGLDGSGELDDERSPEQTGGDDEECDTLAGFDKSPFDADFGAELGSRIQAKVDCELAKAGINVESAGGDDSGGLSDGPEHADNPDQPAGPDGGETAPSTPSNDEGDADNNNGNNDSGEGGGNWFTGLTGDRGEDKTPEQDPHEAGSKGSKTSEQSTGDAPVKASAKASASAGPGEPHATSETTASDSGGAGPTTGEPEDTGPTGPGGPAGGEPAAPDRSATNDEAAENESGGSSSEGSDGNGKDRPDKGPEDDEASDDEAGPGPVLLGPSSMSDPGPKTDEAESD